MPIFSVSVKKGKNKKGGGGAKVINPSQQHTNRKKENSTGETIEPSSLHIYIFFFSLSKYYEIHCFVSLDYVLY